jgi:hypothetical protein
MERVARLVTRHVNFSTRGPSEVRHGIFYIAAELPGRFRYNI